MNVDGFVRAFLLGSRPWEQFSILLARISLGIFFAISGGKKLFVASRARQMYETLAGAWNTVSAFDDVFRFLG